MSNGFKVGSKSYIDHIKSIGIFEKWHIYNMFLSSQLVLKNDFNIVDHSKKNALKGFSNPNKQFLGISFFFHWKDLKIESFDDFISDRNIKNIYHGIDWKKNGFAKKNSVRLSGIYEWYWKLNFNNGKASKTRYPRKYHRNN